MKGLAEHLGVRGNTGPAVSRWPWLGQLRANKCWEIDYWKRDTFHQQSLSLEPVCLNGTKSTQNVWMLDCATFTFPLKRESLQPTQKRRIFPVCNTRIGKDGFCWLLHSNGSSGAVPANIKHWRRYKERKCVLQTAFSNRKRGVTHFILVEEKMLKKN